MKRYLMLLSAGALAIGQQTYGQEHQTGHDQAIVAIRELGGQVIVDSKKPGAPVVVVLTGSRSPGQCLPHLKELSNLHTCDL